MLMPSSGFHFGTVLALIDLVEHSERGTGALICEAAGSRLATVLLEEGRICWAVAAGMQRRLTDLLLESSDANLDRRQLEQIYLECKGKNVPLGEELVKRGVVPPAGLHDALAEHTSEALVRVGEHSQVSYDWLEHRAPGYSPRFTFETLDIAIRVARKVFPEAAQRGQTILESVSLPGIAFLSSGQVRDAFPVASAQPETLPTESELSVRGPSFVELRERIAGLGGEPPDLAYWRANDGAQFALAVHGDLTVAHFLTRPTDLGLLVKARMKT